MKYCENCGSKITMGDKFCRECGMKLTSAAPKELGPITEERFFSYCTQGMAFNSGIDMEITEHDGKLTAKYRRPGISSEDAKTFEIDGAFFDQIVTILDQYYDKSWDDFNMRAQDVFDGTSFNFSFRDGRGRKINASGYMAWPEGLSPAIDSIKALFDEIYETHFPNLFKIFQRYMEEEVIKKYGECCPDAQKAGAYITKIPYLYGDPGYYDWGENPMPEGVFDYAIFSGYEGKDKSNPGLRAVVVLVEKEKDEATNFTYTGLKMQYYGMENDQEVKLLEEFKIKKEAVTGNTGELGIFSFGSPDETTIGMYIFERWHAGNTKERNYLGCYRLTEDKMKDLGNTSVTVSREEEYVPEDGMNALCQKADECGLGFLSIYWHNEWQRWKKIARPMVSNFVGYQWSGNKKFGTILDDPEGKLKGTPIEDWWISVYRLK